MLKDISGKTFGRLTATSEYIVKNNQTKWKFVCSCGTTKYISKSHVVAGNTISCGCAVVDSNKNKRQQHGKTKTTEYNIWNNIRKRCLHEKNPMYPVYGGRGIKICESWLKPDGQGFLNFLADMGNRPSKNFSLDRRDVNSGYSADNCQWVTNSEQAFNKNLSDKNTSGKTGVYFDKRSQKWFAEIRYNDKSIYLGSSVDFSKVVKLRQEAELKYYGFIKE